MMKILQPAGWKRPSGYSNGVAAEGRLVFVSGQVGWDENEVFQSENLVDQVRRALQNTLAVLAEADAGPQHIARMTWYITDRREYLDSMPALGAVYREIIGGHYPAMAMVEVSALIEDGAKVEIETTAVVPPGN